MMLSALENPNYTTMKNSFLLLISLLVTFNFMPVRAQVNSFMNGPPSEDPAVPIGGGWQHFEWNNGPNVFNNEGAWTFASASATALKITDTGVVGDRFSLFDNGVLIGTTSVPANNGYDDESLSYDGAY